MSGIILPFRPIIAPVRLEGWIRLRVYNVHTHKLTKDTGWFRNLITNQGLDAIAQQNDVMTWFTVGTSSSAPNITDTWVFSFVASSNDIRETIDGVSGASPHYGYKRRTIRFGPGAAAGNLSEVAVGWSSSTGTAFSHELIRDEFGDPTTITVLADEYLDFTYELRHIPPTGDVTGSCNINSTPYNYTLRALAVTSTIWWSQYIGNLFTFNNSFESYHRAYSGALAAITASQPDGNDGGSNSGTTSITAAAYTPGNYYRNFTVSAAPSQWNVTGGVIRSLVFGGKGCRWQAEFAKQSDGTGIGKTSGNSLAMNWRCSWARAA